MDIQIAVGKLSKHDSPESGDTLEFVERPNGGVSVVLADGRTSGKTAKAISTMVVRKVIGLLAEGVRDGAAARAASDYLFTEKGGTATAYLNILSVDLMTATIVLSRNNSTPIFVARGENIECVNLESSAIGISRNTKPTISEFPLEAGITVVIFTDGIANAGQSYGNPLDVCTLLRSLLDEQEPLPQEIVDALLNNALRLDQGMPNDDMSIIVLRILPQAHDQVRRMLVHLPVGNHPPVY